MVKASRKLSPSKNNLGNGCECCRTVLLFFVGLVVGLFGTTVLRHILSSTKDCSLFELEKILYNTSKFQTNSTMTIEDDAHLVLIGVSVMPDELDRAKAIYATWGRAFPGQLLFFMTKPTDEEINEDFPLILLDKPGLTATEISYEIFRYMHDHYLNSFRYFMHVLTDSYVLADRLKEVLTFFLKQRTNELDLFCIKGQRRILSKAVLRLARLHFEICQRKMHFVNVFAENDFVTCIEDALGASCISPENVSEFLFKTSKEDFSFFQPESEVMFRVAALVYPMPNADSFYRVFQYVQGLRIRSKEGILVSTQRDINEFLLRLKRENVTLKNVASLDNWQEGIFIDHLGHDVDSLSKLNVGQPRKSHRVSYFPDLNWHFMGKEEGHVFQDKKDGIPNLKGVIHVFQKMLIDAVNRIRLKTEELSFKTLVYAYFRHCPFYGSQYIIDLALDKSKSSKTYRKHSYIQILFGPLYVREIDQNTTPNKSIQTLETTNSVVETAEDSHISDEIVYIIMALSGRLDTFRRFLDEFETEIIRNNEQVILLLVLYGKDMPSRVKVRQMLIETQTKYPQAGIVIIEGDDSDSKSSALALATSSCGDGDLLFFLDVDMTIKAEVLDRIRWFTFPRTQVYYPIVFSEFDPVMARNKTVGSKYDHFLLSQEAGFWRRFGFGMVAIYKEDIDKVGGFNTSIVGWGVEDVDLYNKVMNEKSLRIFRSPDPGLVHVFHIKVCDSRLKRNRFNMCQGSLISVFASHKPLYSYIQANPHVFELGKNKQKVFERKKKRMRVVRRRSNKIKNVDIAKKKFNRLFSLRKLK